MVRSVCFPLIMCFFTLSLSAQNLIKNSGFEDDSEWQVTYHIQDPVSEVVFGFTEDIPAKGDGGCLYVSSFGEREVRPVIYQKITCVAGETYFVTGAIKVIDLDLPEIVPPGPWFQIYINDEEPPDWYEGMGDWNPSTKLLNISAWSGEGCELYNIDGFWEDLSCENDWDNNNRPYFTAAGDPGTEVELYLVMKPGLWLNEGDTGGFEVLIDNVGVYPISSNLIKNWDLDDGSEWQVTYHIQDPVSDVMFGFDTVTPIKGEGPCLYVSAFGAREVRPVIYQPFTCIAGEPYRVSGAIKVIELDLPETVPPGPWFQIYINDEEPPDWYEGMDDWNPSTKLLNISAWSGEECRLYDIDGFWENLSCENDWENNNQPVFVPAGDAGTSVDLYLVMKPGMWLNEGDQGGFEVVIDNIAVYPMTEAGIPGTEVKTGENPAIEFVLETNYPNPFNPITHINYSLPKQQFVTLEVFDLLGQKVATLIDNRVEPAGFHEITFDGSELSSGLYVYRLTAGDQVRFNKMMLIK